LIGTALAAKVILDRMKNQLPFLLFWAVTLDAVLLQERLYDLGKVRIGADAAGLRVTEASRATEQTNADLFIKPPNDACPLQSRGRIGRLTRCLELVVKEIHHLLTISLLAGVILEKPCPPPFTTWSVEGTPAFFSAAWSSSLWFMGTTKSLSP
jgi:hypothetical protein